MLTGYVKTAPEWAPRVLRCRFTLEAHPTPDRLEKARAEAANRFVDDMAKQGWQLVGQLFSHDRPYPSAPKKDGRAHILLPMQVAETWDYEIGGRFIRRLLPTEILDVRPRQASRFDLYGVEHSHAHRDRRAA